MKINTVDVKTRSYTYIFPMLGNNYLEIKHVCNCYIGDNNRKDLVNKIFLLLSHDHTNESEVNSFTKMRQILELAPNFIEGYSINDNYFMCCFDIPAKFEPAYHLFIQGRFSKFPDMYKRHLLKFHNLTIESEIGRVLYRSEKQYKKWEALLGTEIDRDQEIGSMPDIINREVFDTKMLNVNVLTQF